MLVPKHKTDETLRDHGIQPSAQRGAVADYVLYTKEHPSAGLVWNRARDNFPLLYAATVYNTRNLFVKKGLLRTLDLADNAVVFDPKMDKHHLFVDEEDGSIHDVPWEKVQVCNIEGLRGYVVHDYQVVMHGVKKK